MEISPEDTLCITKEMLDPVMAPLLLKYGEWVRTPSGTIKKLPLNWQEIRARSLKAEKAERRKKFSIV
jgi:hypothetical protein